MQSNTPNRKPSFKWQLTLLAGCAAWVILWACITYFIAQHFELGAIGLGVMVMLALSVPVGLTSHLRLLSKLF